MEPIARESLDELKRIFSWVRDRESSLANPITILVGGWAVHSYNDYWGSIDIDLITNNRTKPSWAGGPSRMNENPPQEETNSFVPTNLYGW